MIALLTVGFAILLICCSILAMERQKDKATISRLQAEAKTRDALLEKALNQVRFQKGVRLETTQPMVLPTVPDWKNRQN